MSRIDDLLAARLKKYELLASAGIEAFPAKAQRTHTLAEIREEFDALTKAETKVTILGRIRHIRGHGGSTFLGLTDAEASFQIYLKKDTLGEEVYDRWMAILDIGDIISASGTLFTTKRGEPTLLAADIQMVTKSLRSLPEEYFGLKDSELRLRKRYLDLLLNPEVRELFKQKARFWKSVRDQLTKLDFLEVETPVLEHVPGGAEAEPFVTHYNALDQDVTLRISLELPLKRLLVGGYERVFEIGRIFRNEGMSPEHLQDYTQIEFYWAFADYTDLMKMLPDFYRNIALATVGKTEITNGEMTIDLGKKWKTYNYVDEFKEKVRLDPLTASREDLFDAAKKAKLDVSAKTGKGKLIDALYKKFVRPTLIEPGFLIDPPVEIEPLAKRHLKDPRRVQRLQVMAFGTELGKGFSELNDPIDQRKRFEEQMKLRQAGDKEAQQLDEDFLEALEYGMPPAAGFGMSERLFAYLVDRPIRETVIFPAMKGSEANPT
jgi:lysyl-tRNA synthetase class 2